MKKLLLLAFAAGMVASSANAQTAGRAILRKVDMKQDLYRGIVKDQGPVRASAIVKAAPRPVLTNRNHPKNPNVAAVSKVNISTSANCYGSLLGEGGLLNYEPTLNILSYTNRKSIGQTGGYFANSGTVVARTSRNNGAIWDTTLAAFHTTTQVNRYPSGTVVNPPGNTVADGAYVVAASAVITGTTWDGGTFGSINILGTNANQIDLVNSLGAPQFQTMPRLGMCSGSNGHAYVLGSDYDINATAPYMDGFLINRAVWNSTTSTFDWDIKLIYHAFSHDPADNSQNFATLGDIAFSADGQTGYMVTFGRDSLCDHLSPMPIIYRTTDGGDNWSLYTRQNFSTLFANIWASNPNTVDGTRPYYSTENGMSLVVDGNNKIHIFCEAAQAASDNVDSLNFGIFNNTIYDTYENASGQWVALRVGQIQTSIPALSGSTTGTPNDFGWAVGWDARLQVCRNVDGTKIGYTWADTDPNVSSINEYPDIFGAGLDLTTGMYSDSINFTVGTAYEANNYWQYSARQGWNDAGTGDFVIPMASATPLNAGGIDTDPWMHQYVSGVQIPSSAYVHAIPAAATLGVCTVGIKEVTASVATSSIYPNPAADQTVISVNMNNSSAVNVNVTNALGQTVKSMNLGTVGAGFHSFSMDVNDMPQGFYIVTVTMGSKVVSHKLNVQR